MFSSWQSKYRSVDAKNELENTFNGIATDSDVAKKKSHPFRVLK